MEVLLIHEGKTMSKDAGRDGKLHGSRRKKAARATVSVLIVVPLLILWALLATDDDGNIALTRNDAVLESSGARIWHGTMTNTTDSQYREIDVTIRFLDSADQPVGEVSGRADRLEPGEQLDLQAPLLREADRMQIYSLQWRTGRKNKYVPLGPWAPWPFGYVQTEWP